MNLTDEVLGYMIDKRTAPKRELPPCKDCRGQLLLKPCGRFVVYVCSSCRTRYDQRFVPIRDAK